MVEDLQKEIDEALNADVDLSKEEYEKKCQVADNTTAEHGVEGEAPIDEQTRHDRIEMNFYGIAINYLVNIFATLQDIDEKLKGDK